MQLLLEADDVLCIKADDYYVGGICNEQEQKLALIYTVASSVAVFECFFAGILLDKAGPVICVSLAGICVASGALLFAVSAPNNLSILLLAGVLLAMGGGLQLTSSFLVAFVCATKHVSLVCVSLNCLMDASTGLFLLFYLLYSSFTRFQIFSSYAALAVVVYVPLVWLWRRVGMQIVEAKKQQAKSEGEGAAASVQQQQEQLKAPLLSSSSSSSSSTSSSHFVDDYNLVDEESGSVAIRNDKATNLHALSWRRQVFTKQFVCLTVFASLHLLRANSYMGIVGDLLLRYGDGDHVYTDIYSSILPLGFVFIPLIEPILSRCSFAQSFQLVTLFGSLCSSLALIPNLPLQVLTFLLFAFYRSLFYSACSAFVTETFGVRNAGRAYGMVWLIASFFNLLLYPALLITDKYFDGNLQWYLSFLLSLCIPLVAVVHYGLT